MFGDFRRLHSMGLIACYYRAAEWEHTEVMVAAHNLLLYLNQSRTSSPSRCSMFIANDPSDPQCRFASRSARRDAAFVVRVIARASEGRRGPE